MGASIERGASKRSSRPYIPAGRSSAMTLTKALSCAVLAAISVAAPARAEDPDPIFKKSTVWRPLTPNDKLAVYGIDDPAVDGVACHYTVPEKGGVKGGSKRAQTLTAEQRQDIARLAARARWKKTD